MSFSATIRHNPTALQEIQQVSSAYSEALTVYEEVNNLLEQETLLGGSFSADSLDQTYQQIAALFLRVNASYQKFKTTYDRARTMHQQVTAVYGKFMPEELRFTLNKTSNLLDARIKVIRVAIISILKNQVIFLHKIVYQEDAAAHHPMSLYEAIDGQHLITELAKKPNPGNRF